MRGPSWGVPVVPAKPGWQDETTKDMAEGETAGSKEVGVEGC